MIELTEIGQALYSSTQEADDICSSIQRDLGWTSRYYTAKLAIARSLSAPLEAFGLKGKGDDKTCTEIRGYQLFGKHPKDHAAWLALITQHSGMEDMEFKDFRRLVFHHWDRGARLLRQDWEQSGGEFDDFVMKLAGLASAPMGNIVGHENSPPKDRIYDEAIKLPAGPTAEYMDSMEPVIFELNAPGNSPHMAFMGGTNSGKTYTAITMLKRLREVSQIPILAFDFKGDLSEKLAPEIGATVVSPPQDKVPLDVFAITRNDEDGIKDSAGRLRESILRVKVSRSGGVQKDFLRQALVRALRKGVQIDQSPTLKEVSESLRYIYDEEGHKPDELSATLNELCDFDLFDASLRPAHFFSKSWVIRLPQDGSPEVRRLIVNLLLDSLDRWINSQADTPRVNGCQAMRHICMLDEAHVILRTKLPALANLIRMSRSKGGCLMLASQSPDDFASKEENFLDNMGLTLAFATQAKVTSAKNVFGLKSKALIELKPGEALCKMRGKPTQIIQAWTPSG